MTTDASRPTLDTTIAAVTVYPDRARITRSGTLYLTGLETALVITPLPTTLRTDSVRVKGSGDNPVRLYGVQVQSLFSEDPIAHQVADLTQQIQALKLEEQEVAGQIAATKLQQQAVELFLTTAAKRLGTGIHHPQFSLLRTQQLFGFGGTCHQTYGKTTIRAQEQLRQLEMKRQTLEQQLQACQTPRPRNSYRVITEIEPEGSGEFTLEVSYVVYQASWRPLYDCRTTPEGDQLTLNYLADVQQHSGEDWHDTVLTLSTAKTAQGSLPPRLDPWYVGLSAADGWESAVAESASSPVPQMARARVSAQAVTAKVENTGGVVTFQLPRPGSVPSDNQPHKFMVFTTNYACQPEYVTIPKLVSYAYLRTVAHNPTDGVSLLPGSVNLFRADEFVGTTSLEAVAPGQLFKLDLGIDESIQVERDLIERQLDKKLMSNQRRLIIGYRLTLTNLSERRVSLQVQEPLPVSQSEQVKIRLTRSDPSIQAGELGILVWTITLAPQEKRILTYQFALEYPSDQELVGLNI